MLHCLGPVASTLAATMDLDAHQGRTSAAARLRARPHEPWHARAGADHARWLPYTAARPCSRELARTWREAPGLLRDVDGLVHEGLPATSLVHGVAGLRVAQHETNYEPLAAIVSAGVAVKERRRAFDPGTHDAP